jgi:glycosyltransferase involved in cell wall biosynthesis
LARNAASLAGLGTREVDWDAPVPYALPAILIGKSPSFGSGAVTRQMRILWLSHLVPYPPKGGVQQRSYNLIRELSKHHEVILLAFNQRAHLKDAPAVNDAVSHFSQFCKVEAVLPIDSDGQRFGRARLALRSLFGSQPYTIQWLDSTDYENAVTSAIRKYSPDAIHVDTISLARYRLLAPKIPAALNHHNIESDMLLRRAELESNLAARFYYWQEGKRLRSYERSVATNFEAHFTCSALDAQRLVTVVNKPLATVVIPNGVDLAYFQPTGQHDKKPESMVFAGRMSWYPNAAAMRFMVREVWPLMTKQCPGATLTIIGKSPEQELIAAAARDPRITVTGFVDDVRPYLESASVYVCPIFDGGGTKLKILDALAMGCALVAHPVACEGIEVTAGKNVLFATTAPEFVAATARLFEDPALRLSLAVEARRLAQSTYSFVEIGRKLAASYESLGESLGR